MVRLAFKENSWVAVGEWVESNAWRQRAQVGGQVTGARKGDGLNSGWREMDKFKRQQEVKLTCLGERRGCCCG